WRPRHAVGAVHSATRSTTSPAPTACRGRHEPPALGRAPRRKDDKPKLQRGMAHPGCRGGRAAGTAPPGPQLEPKSVAAAKAGAGGGGGGWGGGGRGAGGGRGQRCPEEKAGAGAPGGRGAPRTASVRTSASAEGRQAEVAERHGSPCLQRGSSRGSGSTRDLLVVVRRLKAPRFVSLLETFPGIVGANMPETRRYPLNIPG